MVFDFLVDECLLAIGSVGVVGGRVAMLFEGLFERPLTPGREHHRGAVRVSRLARLGPEYVGD